MIFITQTCQLTEWASERDRLGLRVWRMEARSDPQTAQLILTAVLDPQNAAGEPVRVIRPGEHLEQSAAPAAEETAPAEPGGIQMPVTLRDTLTDLVQRAQADPGQPKRAFLRGGMRIDLRITSERTDLQISRQGADPSATEWNVVLANMPYEVPLVEDRALAHQGRHYRAASWSTPEGGQE